MFIVSILSGRIWSNTSLIVKSRICINAAIINLFFLTDIEVLLHLATVIISYHCAVVYSIRCTDACLQTHLDGLKSLQSSACVWMMRNNKHTHKPESLYFNPSIGLLYYGWVGRSDILRQIYHMRGWVCWVVPEKRAGCSSVEVNPRWWRNFINLTYCSWWHRDTEDTKRNRLVMTGTRRERERDVCRCWSSQQHWNISMKQQLCSEFVHTWLDEAFLFPPPLPRSSSSPMAATPHDPTWNCDTSWWTKTNNNKLTSVSICTWC